MQEIYYPSTSNGLKFEPISELQLKGLYLQQIGGWPVTRSIKVSFDELEWDKSIVDPDWDREFIKSSNWSQLAIAVFSFDLLGLSPEDFNFDGWQYQGVFKANRTGSWRDKVLSGERITDYEYAMVKSRIVSYFPKLLNEEQSPKLDDTRYLFLYREK